jgi:hypothetical protein
MSLDVANSGSMNPGYGALVPILERGFPDRGIKPVEG